MLKSPHERAPLPLAAGTVGVLLIALVVAPARGQTGMVRGPYLNDVRTDSIVVRWDTATPCVGVVRFMARGGQVREQQEAAPAKRHAVRLIRLAPGTEYLYQVEGGGVASERATFRTAVPPGQGFSFVAYGDSRSRLAEHRKVADAILAARPAFVLHTGDMAGDGRKLEDWKVFFQGAANLLPHVPVFPCLGNHERNSRLYFEFFTLPGPSTSLRTSPSTGPGQVNGRYYSFDYGDCHFVALDSDPPYVTDAAQLDWLARDLREHQQAALTFAFFHHPPYSVASHGSNKAVQDNFCPLFERHGVDVVFAGHDHDYQRNEVGGITYIVTDGGGAPLYEQKTTAAWNKAFKAVLHYVLVTFDPGRKSALLQAFTPEGRRLDQVEVGG